MSSVAVLWAADARQSGPMKPGTRLVLIHLADHAGADHLDAWPSIETLQHRTGLGRRTVIAALRELQDAGTITRGDQTRVASYRADTRPVVYHLKALADATGCKIRTPRNGVQETTPRGAENSTNGVQILHPNQELEPKTEPHPLTPSALADVVPIESEAAAAAREAAAWLEQRERQEWADRLRDDTPGAISEIRRHLAAVDEHHREVCARQVPAWVPRRHPLYDRAVWREVRASQLITTTPARKQA